MIADAWHHQRMRIGDRQKRQRTRIGALFLIVRYQSRISLDVLEIFDDGQRLEHRVAVMNEGRYHALGVDGFIARFELFAGEDIDGNFLEWQALKLKTNSHTK